jgi:hypothetical protein
MPRLTGTLRPHDPEIDPDILLQVGRIVSYWGRIDHTLDSNIRAMWHAPACASLRQPMPNAFGRRLQLWDKLCRLVWPTRSARLIEADAISAQLKRLAPIRQKIVHGYWSASVHTPRSVTISYRRERSGQLFYEEISINDDDLKVIADELKNSYLYLTHLSLILLIDTGSLPSR